MEYSRIMAIDFGMKRVGIALSDPLRIIASPYCVLENNDRLLDSIAKIVEEQSVSEIVLGYPVREDGSDTHATKPVRLFKEQLEKRFTRKITLIDERYSSQIAQERIRESVQKKMKRRNKGLLDMNAAAVILEDYMKNQ